MHYFWNILELRPIYKPVAVIPLCLLFFAVILEFFDSCSANNKGYQPRVRVEFDRAFQLSLIASIAKALMLRPLFLISSPHLEQFRTYLEHLSPMPISRISITARGHLCAQGGCAVHGHWGRLAIPPACLMVHGFGCWHGLTGCGWAGCLLGVACMCLMFLV